MSDRHWFLPESPDVIGILVRQCEIAVAGLDAFDRWAQGDAEAAAALREAEERGDRAKRELLEALRAAFVTPLEPEDAFALSRSIDRILNAARDIIVEAEVLDCPPDAGIAEMAQLIRAAVDELREAIAGLAGDRDVAVARADAAVGLERKLDAAYTRGMAGLLGVDDRSLRIGLRELYRRCAGIGDVVIESAERVIYAVMKQS